jgi:quercetin dioxygenase-like cupin family protein
MAHDAPSQHRKKIRRMTGGERATADEPVDLAALSGTGPLWGTATEDLNATLLAWPPGHVLAEHVNRERDVLLVVVAGSAAVRLDDAEHVLEAPSAVVIPKGRRRSITAGPGGVRYLTAHLVRPGLEIRR